MARQSLSLGRKRSLSRWKMKSSSESRKPPAPAKKRSSHKKIKFPLLEKFAKKKMDLKLMEDTVGYLRRETENDKNSLTEDKAQLRRLETQLVQRRTELRQEGAANDIRDVCVKFQLAIIDAEDAEDWVTANNLAHELRELMRAFGLR